MVGAIPGPTRQPKRRLPYAESRPYDPGFNFAFASAERMLGTILGKKNKAQVAGAVVDQAHHFSRALGALFRAADLRRWRAIEGWLDRNGVSAGGVDATGDTGI